MRGAPATDDLADLLEPMARAMGDAGRAYAVLDIARTKDRPRAYAAECLRRERQRASGVYEPGERVAVDGMTYTANENGRIPLSARMRLESEREMDRPAYYRPDGLMVAGTGRFRGYLPDGRYCDPGI